MIPASMPESPGGETTARATVVPPSASTSVDAVQALHREALTCRACPLHQERTHTAWGYGGVHPRVLVVGDGPGVEADQAGVAFAGEERELLDRMLAAMRLESEQVFVTNALLCRLPEAAPDRTAVATCRRYLTGLIDQMHPELVILMGAWTTRAVLGERVPFAEVRGRLVLNQALGLPVLATLHPRDLLRFPANKRVAWGDLQVAMAALGLSPLSDTKGH